MSVDAFAAAFPVLTATVGGAGFLADLAKMQPHFAGDRAELKVPRKGRPRGFWNTCGAWCFDDHPGAKASAAFRLAVIEAGLVQAKRAGKEQKFRKEFLNNEEGFEAPSLSCACLGRSAPSLRPWMWSAPPKRQHLQARRPHRTTMSISSGQTEPSFTSTRNDAIPTTRSDR